MTLLSTNPPRLERSSNYRQAMLFLNRGEWAEAIRALEELLRHHPHHLTLRQALEDARLKAQLDAETHIRLRRWILPQRYWWVPAVLGMGLLLLVGLGVAVLQRQIAFQVASTEGEQTFILRLHEGNDFLINGDLSNAEQRFRSVLAEVPNHAQALVGLAQAQQEQVLLHSYQQAIALQTSDDCANALPLYRQLLAQRTSYRDVADRMTQCNQRQDAHNLLTEAGEAEKNGAYAEAIQHYETARQQGTTILATGTRIEVQLATLYAKVGLAALTAPTLSAEVASTAREAFKTALRYDPENREAARENTLLSLYLDGRSTHEQQDWRAAILNLRPIIEERSDYLGGAAAALLYDAYLAAGDSYRATGDCVLADEQYNSAAALPLNDVSAAQANQTALATCATPPPFEAIALIPPPASPVEAAPNTPAPTQTPESTQPIAVTPPTPSAPAALPLQSLALYHNQIVFKSNNQARPGFWVMDSTGKNRQFLAPFAPAQDPFAPAQDPFATAQGPFDAAQVQAQYSALLETYRRSPDGEFHVYVDELNEVSQVYIARLDGAWPPKPLTTLTGISYDPQWSPKNGAVVFVTQENGSDDIWMIGADGETLRPLVRNSWEWDKQPTWSPDGSQIAFWSNRSGLKQIYVLDVNSQTLNFISNVAWDEYDPLWIR